MFEYERALLKCDRLFYEDHRNDVVFLSFLRSTRSTHATTRPSRPGIESSGDVGMNPIQPVIRKTRPMKTLVSLE